MLAGIRRPTRRRRRGEFADGDIPAGSAYEGSRLFEVTPGRTAVLCSMQHAELSRGYVHQTA